MNPRPRLFLTEREANRLLKSAGKPPKKSLLSPAVSKTLKLPSVLQSWAYLFDEWNEKWFEETTYLHFSALAAQSGGRHLAHYRHGSLNAVNRILQIASAKPLNYVVEKDVWNNGLSSRDVGLVYLKVSICLQASDASIIGCLKEVLATLRLERSLPAKPARPTDVKNLQRDFVIFSLSQAKWPINAIENQLKHMGCRPIPKDSDHKDFIRRLSPRFSSYINEIVKLSGQDEKSDAERFMKCFLESHFIEKQPNGRGGKSRRKR